MNKKNALGRGLGALIDTTDAQEVSEVDISLISPNPHQPRKVFEQESLEELAKSIKSQGVLQPILLNRATDGKLYIVVGERRWRAAKLAGKKKIPAIIKAMNKKEVMESALIENIQREDLNAIDQAEAFKKLMTEFTYTQEELSEVVGKSRSAVANILRLLKLPEDMKEALRKGLITEGHGRALLAVEDAKQRTTLFNKMLNEKIPVRKAEQVSKKKKQIDANISAIEERLSQALKTKVYLQGKNKKGKLIIEYYSFDQLDEIIKKLED